jgi:hypothetical protein
VDQRLARIEEALSDFMQARQILTEAPFHERATIGQDDLMWAIADIRAAADAIQSAMRRLHIRQLPKGRGR